MTANAASATVKVTHRISDSRNISRSNRSISHGTSEGSPCISGSTSESSPCISSGTSIVSIRNRNRSTTGISRDISHISPHSIQGDGVHHAFVSGIISTGIFCQSTAQYPPHRPCVFLTSTRTRKLPHIFFLETTPTLRADLVPHHNQPPRRRTRMDSPFRPSRPRALSPTRPPWRNLSKLRVPSASVVRNITVSGSYPHSMFIVQSSSNEDDVWIADSGASCHMTHDGPRTYNMRPPPPGRVYQEHGCNSHGKTGQRITLIDVAYVPGLGFNLYSLHTVQKPH